MRIVTVSEIRRNLSRALDMLTNGEGIIITRYGKPIARLVAASEKHYEASGK